MIRMAFHFIGAMFRHQWGKLRGYEIFSPKGVMGFRNRTCRRCEHNEDGQCDLCKCLILSKTMMALESCPIGKWGRAWIKKPRGRRGFWRRLFNN